MQQLREPPLRFDDRDAFYAWAEQQPGKWERENGVVLPMAPASNDHSTIKGNVYSALRAAIRTAGVPRLAFVDGPAVQIGAGSDYIPDVVVNCGERGAGTERAVRNPVVVVEVMSPSTAARDMTHKFSGYSNVPSVQHYLLVAPDECLVMHHSRLEADKFLTHLLRREDGIDLDPPGLQITVAELYADTDLAEGG